MVISRAGLSTFILEVQPDAVAITDPWMSGNPTAVKELLQPDKLARVSAILVSHGHSDHATGINDLQKASPRAHVYCPFELAFLLMSDGITNVHLMNVGGSSRWGDNIVTMVPASHSSSFGPSNQYAGPACGIVLTLSSGYRIYYAGDTSLSADLRLIGDYWKPDLALLPCGGVLTMDVDQAVYAAGELLRVPHVIPCHYFPTVDFAPDPVGMTSLVENAPVVAEMMAHGAELRDQMAKRYPIITVTVLELGESAEVST